MVREPEVVVRAQQHHRLALEQHGWALWPAEQAQAAAETESLQLGQALFDLAHRWPPATRPGLGGRPCCPRRRGVAGPSAWRGSAAVSRDPRGERSARSAPGPADRRAA